jgi:hypothetical protein
MHPAEQQAWATPYLALYGRLNAALRIEVALAT